MSDGIFTVVLGVQICIGLVSGALVIATTILRGLNAIADAIRAWGQEVERRHDQQRILCSIH